MIKFFLKINSFTVLNIYRDIKVQLSLLEFENQSILLIQSILSPGKGYSFAANNIINLILPQIKVAQQPYQLIKLRLMNKILY